MPLLQMAKDGWFFRPRWGVEVHSFLCLLAGRLETDGEKEELITRNRNEWSGLGSPTRARPEPMAKQTV